MMIVVMMMVMTTIILVLVCGRWTEFFFSWVKDWLVSIVLLGWLGEYEYRLYTQAVLSWKFFSW